MATNLVIIPTYNEKQNISELINLIFNQNIEVDILVVDDNSPDGTGKVVDELISSKIYENHLFIMHREKKQGLGKAYIAGFTWGLEKGYNLLCSMDADFSHHPKYLPKMFDLANKYDLVIGSRNIPGGGIKNWSLLRKIISRGGNIYAQIILLSKIRDLTGGFNCYHASWLRKIKLENILSSGYCFQIEMKFRHALAKAKICEFPIIFEDRQLGVSKMSGNIFAEAVINVVKLSLSRNKIRKQEDL